MRSLNLGFILLIVAAAFVAHALGVGPLVTFIVAALAIIPLSALLGRATEELAFRIGPFSGSLLNATFGNAAELIVGLVALRRGMLAIVKASLTGSIIGTALFVLGASLLVGGVRHGRQSFDRLTIGLQSTLLVLAAIGMTVPSLLYQTLGPATETRLSQEVAGVLLGTYVLGLIFVLVTQREPDRGIVGVQPAAAQPTWSVFRAVTVLAGASVLVAFLSDLMVGAIQEAQQSGRLAAWGMSDIFVGVIVVAIVGNAAEHSAAVMLAYRNQVGLALHIAVGSSLQIALFLTPVLVFASLALAPQPMDLHFTLLEVMAVGASVVVVALVAADGQCHWMEGVLLLALYIILALAFFHLPVP